MYQLVGKTEEKSQRQVGKIRWLARSGVIDIKVIIITFIIRLTVYYIEGWKTIYLKRQFYNYSDL